MELQICGQMVNGNVIPVNTKGMETIEAELMDISVLSRNKSIRLVGIDKKLYRLTLKSYKELKKALNRRGSLYRVAV